MVRPICFRKITDPVDSRLSIFSRAVTESIELMTLCQHLMLVCGLLWSSILHAQIPFTAPQTTSDSLRKSAADSARIIQPIGSGAAVNQKPSADSVRTAFFMLPQIGFRLDTAATSTCLFQDFAQLASQTLPIIPILTGEVGQPRYLATADAPARVVQTSVDEVSWIPGVYGTVDLTSLPDATVQKLEEVGASPHATTTILSPYVFHLASDSLDFKVPFSRIEYAKGPFGADAVRIRFGRALGKHLATYLNSAFSNSDGQFVDRPYEGHKVNAQFDYLLTSTWKLQYRHFNSRNEVGVGVPFFPEEWPGLSQAFHKEERLYHAFELSSANRFSLRGFVWQVKEELRDPLRRHRHRLRDGGAEIKWAKQNAQWALHFQNRIALEAIKSTSINDHSRIYEQIAAAVGLRLFPKIWLSANGHFAYKENWPAGAALQAKLIANPSRSFTWWLSGGVWKIPPALGERDNTLPYFAPNDHLQAADLQHGEIGLKWQSARFDGQVRLSGSVWNEGLVFKMNSPGNSGSLYNSNRQWTILAAQLHLHWEFARRWHFFAISAQTANELPRDFWFWHQPEGCSRVYLETLQSFFDGDLEILPRLAGRFIGRRYSPAFAPDAVELLDHELPRAAVLDLQIRLRHGDGALLFSWENVLNQQFDWRSGVPAVGRFLRWGFWWNFLN
ncbi:MAG: hypothetical protein ONB44_04100 [candidate division KSB1 bacterium]|nr:hypothetical protein [candidate division KSB1 bacterium]MDZ7301313.1 hypothetical protein [candidate division KSB1 bacterium]MDZ7310802.1 hypothetical protein [candidate division KSB1 bacterium]